MCESLERRITTKDLPYDRKSRVIKGNIVVVNQMKDYEVGYSIHGQRIMDEARKANDPTVIVKSARPKAQRMVLTEKAF